MRTIGIFGGSFNPIHMGHVLLARQSLGAFSLDLLAVIPSGNHPFKGETETVTAEDRYQMAVAAFAEDDRIAVSDMEIRTPGVGYTIDTLARMAEAFPEDRLVLVQGADIVFELDRWHRADELGRYCSVGVASRRGFMSEQVEERIYELRDSLNLRIDFAEMDIPDISSTELRAMLAEGRDCAGLIPDPALRIILERGLYT